MKFKMIIVAILVRRFLVKNFEILSLPFSYWLWECLDDSDNCENFSLCLD